MAGTILVPTPQGNVPMTLEQARQYQATHAQGFTDPANPNVSPQLREAIQDPKIQQAIQSGASTQVKVGETTFRISNGQVTHYTTGSLWKPIAAALATAAGGYALGTLGGAAPASSAGATGTGGSGVAGVLPSTTTVPTSTGTLAGLPSWASAGGVPAATTGSRVASALLNPSILSAGIGTAGQLIGAHMASSGATEAAKIQAAYLEKALEYEKQRDAYQQQLEASRYGNIQQHLGPYMQLGESAAARIQKLLGGGALPGMVQQPSVPHETIATPDIGVLPTQQPSGAPVLHTNPIPQRRI